MVVRFWQGMFKVDCFGCFGCLGRGYALTLILNGIDNDRYKEIKYHECRYQNEWNKEHPGEWIDLHNRAHNAHRPAFQRHDLEQRIQTGAQSAKPVRKNLAKQLSGNNSGNIEHQAQQSDDASHARQCRKQRLNDDFHARHNGYQAQYPQHTQGAQYSQRPAGGDECDGDDQRIE